MTPHDAAPSTTATRMPRTAPARAEAAGSPKIMIVDDEPIVIKTLMVYLRRGGYEDLVATTESTSTVAMIRKCQPDLILLDLNMPDVSGADILAAILADDLLAGIPVIVVTASCDEETRKRVLSLGARTVILKPVDAIEIVSRVRDVLEVSGPPPLASSCC